MKRRDRWIFATSVLAAASCLVAARAPADQPGDAWITTRVKLSLLRAETVDGLAIDVDTLDGHVTLHGTAGSLAARAAARQRAASVGGVRSVRDLVAVVPEYARDEVADRDAALGARVEEHLAREPDLAESDVEVRSVHDGIVLLSGEADTATAHRRALQAAGAVEGVRLVASEIRSPDDLADRMLWSEVFPAGIVLEDATIDTWIAGKVESSLVEVPGLTRVASQVECRDGVVLLFGTVRSEEDKVEAERRVIGIPGVRAVRNELQVVPPRAAARAQALDERVEQAVRERLQESVSLEESIDVQVSNGVVHLAGEIDDLEGKEKVLSTAESAEGVVRIVDGLRVRDRSRG